MFRYCGFFFPQKTYFFQLDKVLAKKILNFRGEKKNLLFSWLYCSHL